MFWYKRAAITLDERPLDKVVSELVGKYEDAVQEERLLSQKPFNVQEYNQLANKALSFLPQELAMTLGPSVQDIMSSAQAALQSRDAGQLGVTGDKTSLLLNELLEINKRSGFKSWESIRSLFNLLSDMDSHLTVAVKGGGSDGQAWDYETYLLQEKGKGIKQFERLRVLLSRFLASMPRGKPAEIMVQPMPSESELGLKELFPLSFHVLVQFPRGEQGPMEPSFTVFDNGGKYEIDDVLDLGDTDFFADDEEARTYFGMINFLRKGGMPAGDKFLTLYRGMSANEFNKWLGGEAIPEGKFFTSSPTAQMAQDIPGEFPELFRFRVREDCVYETSSGTYQLSRDCQMDRSKRITPKEQGEYVP